jgi:predicted transcriptional regulator
MSNVSRETPHEFVERFLAEFEYITKEHREILKKFNKLFDDMKTEADKFKGREEEEVAILLIQAMPKIANTFDGIEERTMA